MRRRRPGAELPGAAGDLDRAVGGRRLHRYRHARARDRHREASRPVDRGREPAGRLRHARPGPDGGDRQARRLHARTAADHGVPLSVHDQDHLRSRQGLQLHHRGERLYLRGGGEERRAMEDVPGAARRGQGQSRQDQLWITGPRHQPAHHHGADRQAAGHQMDPCALQGQRRDQHRDPRRPHPRGRRFERLGTAGEHRVNCACW